MKLFSLLVIFKLMCIATTAPLDNDIKPSRAEEEAKIPPYIRKIYKKMSQAMEQDDLHTSLKYLRTVQTVHWLEPVTHSKNQHNIVNNIFVTSVYDKLCQQFGYVAGMGVIILQYTDINHY